MYFVAFVFFFLHLLRIIDFRLKLVSGPMGIIFIHWLAKRKNQHRKFIPSFSVNQAPNQYSPDGGPISLLTEFSLFVYIYRYHYWLLYRLPENPDTESPPGNQLIAPVGKFMFTLMAQ